MKIYIDKKPNLQHPIYLPEDGLFMIPCPFGPYLIEVDSFVTSLYHLCVQPSTLLWREVGDLDDAVRAAQKDYEHRKSKIFKEVEINLGPGVYEAKEHMVDFENGYEEALQDIRWAIQDALGTERT